MSESAPFIHFDGLPADEMQPALIVQNALSSFKSHVDQFAAALSLFDSVKATQAQTHDHSMTLKLASWAFVPCRDGAMSIYHAYTVLDGVRQTLKAAPELLAMVDRRELKAAGDVFHTQFRTFEAMRHAVAHVGDKMKTPEKLEEHAIKGAFDFGGIRIEGQKGYSTISNLLNGRRYSNSWNGKILSYEISDQSLLHLQGAQYHLWSAFRAAERETNSRAAAAHERPEPSKPDEPPT